VFNKQKATFLLRFNCKCSFCVTDIRRSVRQYILTFRKSATFDLMSRFTTNGPNWSKQMILIRLLLLLLSPLLSSAQQWTWMHGSNSLLNVLPVYGTQGVPNASNTPGGRVGSACWVDNNNNLWLFGGRIRDEVQGVGYLMSDMWKYDVTLNQWAWMSGPSSYTSLPSYGTKGVPASGNWPGGRWMMGHWKSANGDFWLYGGANNATTKAFADLWRYNVSTNQWTWMSGSSTYSNNVPIAYGTQGVPSSTAFPGSRYSCQTSADNAGNLWLYGGLLNFPGTIAGDVWSYNIASNMWTYAVPTGTTTYPTSYGTMGVGSASTHPGARTWAFSFEDNSGNMWIHGTQNKCDLWKFDVSTSIWTWMSGSSQGCSGSYGTIGVPSTTIFPIARFHEPGEGGLKDSNGSLLFFGGTNGINAMYNDLWKYIPSTGVWIWMQGSNQPDIGGIYGTQGVAGSFNYPGAREGQCMWMDNNGKLWIYGGRGYNQNGGPQVYGLLNDLWGQGTCVSPPMPVNTTSQSICNQSTATLSVNAGSGVKWYSTAVSTSSIGSGTTFVTPTMTTSSSPSVYTYYAESTGSCGITFVRVPVTVTVLPSPTISLSNGVICNGSSFTLNATGASSFVWSTSGTTNSIVVTPSVTTVYSVTGTSTIGCSASKAATVVVNPLPVVTVNSGSICSGGSFQLVPSGAANYNITGGQSLVSPTVTTSYSVTGTSTAGCTSTLAAVATVTVFNTPSISVNSGSICMGSSFIMVPSGASTYTFSNGSATVSPSTTTSYTLTGASTAGCLSTLAAVATVTVNANPTISVSNGTICEGEKFLLNPSGAVNYTYSSVSPQVTPTVNSTYTINGESAAGCKALATASVEVNACTGVSEKEPGVLLLFFPNPTDGRFNIQGAEGVLYRLTDITGRIVMEGRINDQEQVIHAEFCEGIYMLTGTKDGHHAALRIVVIR
jgi:hypothetical protein